MKRLAVVAGGWHFPLHFFQKIAEQQIPEGWEVDLFCISHRDPEFSAKDKESVLPNLGYDRRGLYDRVFYSKIATVAEIEGLGFKYHLEPNTMGDWGNTNQWLAQYDYKKYDKFLFTHDDNFILTNQMFMDLLPQDDWVILTNSDGHSPGRKRTLLGKGKEFSIRGSFEFFTKEMLDYLGGSFDMSEVSLTREGETSSSSNLSELADWNNQLYPVLRLIEEKNLKPRIKYLSKYYRMSLYCLEGERGFIHITDPLNTKEEDKGLDVVEQHYKTHKPNLR
jgi:hypothetical protein